MTKITTMTMTRNDIESAIADMLIAKGFFSPDTDIVKVDLQSEESLSFSVTYNEEEEDRTNLDHFLQSATVLPFVRSA